MAHVQLARRSRGHLAALAAVLLCVLFVAERLVAQAPALFASAGASSRAPAASAAPLETSRADLLRSGLVVPAAAGAFGLTSPPALALEIPKPGEPPKRGDFITIPYDGNPGDDFRIAKEGDGITTATGKEFVSRVVYVKPGGVAASYGARAGDELVCVRKKEIGADDRLTGKLGGYILETKMRMAEDVDFRVKDEIGRPDFKGTNVGAGGALVLKSRAVVQPGEQAPDFQVPCVFPLKGNPVGECSLADGIEDGKRLVLFFRPGIRFSKGDSVELKMLEKLRGQFEELGVNFATVTSDVPFKAQKQAKAYQIGYPMLIDPGYMSNSYGALKELDNIGASVDRNTFIISPDGKIERTYVGIGWDPTKQKLAGHLADVIKALGGDRQRAYETVLPKEMTVGDAIELSQKAFDKAIAN